MSDARNILYGSLVETNTQLQNKVAALYKILGKDQMKKLENNRIYQCSNGDIIKCLKFRFALFTRINIFVITDIRCRPIEL